MKKAFQQDAHHPLSLTAHALIARCQHWWGWRVDPEGGAVLHNQRGPIFGEVPCPVGTLMGQSKVGGGGLYSNGLFTLPDPDSDSDSDSDSKPDGYIVLCCVCASPRFHSKWLI